MMEPDIRLLYDNTYAIEEQGVRFFLLTGKSDALLIDSGMQTRNAKEIAEGLTKLPLKLLNTHADPDHIGSNAEFDSFYMNSAERGNYTAHNGTGTIVPIEDGDVIDLGERPLEIITLPGHTPGSIAVLDVNNRVIFSGDPVQDYNVFMFGPQRDMSAYSRSLDKLLLCKARFDTICPSHGTCPLEAGFLDALRVETDALLAGRITGEEKDMFGHKVMLYRTKVCGFLLPMGQI